MLFDRNRNRGLKLAVRHILERFGLLEVAEEIRFWFHSSTAKLTNRRYARAHAPFVFPPGRLLYETSSAVDFPSYLEGGKFAAAYFTSLADTYLRKDGQLTVCEWGCGVGRIIRHFPHLQPRPFGRIIGTDYDRRMIRWCAQNIRDVEFLENSLAPPLPLDDQSVDFLYALSVLTHLTEELHRDWLRDLLRVVRVNGVLLLSTMGEGVKHLLSSSERTAYHRGELVMRPAARVGGRLFAAYQSPAYMHSLFRNVDVLNYIPGQPGDQDLWLIRRR